MPEPRPAGPVLRAAAAALGGETPRLDAELLMAHVLGIDRTALLLDPPVLTVTQQAAFAELVRRRAGHEPVAHLTGQREFWSLSLAITRATLVPRPDSETLIVAALAAFRDAPPALILDLGTGSGALLLAALSEWPAATGVGIDYSMAALDVARANAVALGLSQRCTFLHSDWTGALEGRFDLILCNPPYIPDGTALMPDVAEHEPPGALFGGPDGLDAYRLLFPQMAPLLEVSGVALFEFGEGQADALCALAAASGCSWTLHHDLAGRPRALELRLPAQVGLGKVATSR